MALTAAVVPRYAGTERLWRSQQDFDKFGATLLPIIQPAGADAGPPVVEPVHGLIPG